MGDLEQQLLATIDSDGGISSSLQFAQAQRVDHMAVVGVIKSLESYDMITVKVRRAFTCVNVYAAAVTAMMQSKCPLQALAAR